jgi:hypothetical protein
MVEVKEQKYKVNFARIEQICEKRGITKKAVSIAAGKSKNLTSDSYFTACKKTNTKWTQRQLMDVNALVKTQKKWTLLTLDNEENTEEHVSVEENKAKNAPIAETIINENETDNFTEEIHERIIKNLQKSVYADLKEMAKKYGLEVADIIALGMKF